MRGLNCFMTLLAFLVPVVSQASQTWSSCQTVTGVSNYMASDSSILVSLSPGIPGCARAGVSGAIGVKVGFLGVDSTNIGGFLATGLTALSTGRGVMIFYDNSSADCYTQIVAVGGYAGQY